VTEARLSRRTASEGISVKFDELILRFPASNEWAGAVWEFSTGNWNQSFPAPSISEIAGLSERFRATVVDGGGLRQGPFSIQSVICGFPSSSLCFLCYADLEGMWVGHTVAKSFGTIVVVPYRIDPT
jgi:hypothetical protein